MLLSWVYIGTEVQCSVCEGPKSLEHKLILV